MEKYDGNVHIDHIGIACNDLEVSSKFWRLIGLNESENDEIVEEQGVKTRFFDTSTVTEIDAPPRFELLEPTGSDTPIGKFLDKRGEGVQQVCIRVDDIEKMIRHLISNGIKMINETPVKGTHDCLIAFVHPKSTGGVLIELAQKN